jgi:hypothetical protein
MERKRRRNRLIAAIAGITFFILIIFLKDVMEPKERNISRHRVDDTILCLMDVDKDPRGVDYELPEGLTEWIAQSLEAGDWDKRLKEIAAEYKVLSTSEKREYFTEQQAEDYAGLAYYCIEKEPLLLKDKWYLVSLSEYGEDIVIESYDLGGDKCVYCFINLLGSNVYTEPPMWAIEEREIGSPYFISWEGVNYMAVPVWKEGNEEILGIEVYDYHTTEFVGVITGIMVDENGDRRIKSQKYLFTTPRSDDMGETWSLEVLSEEER